MPNLSRCLGLAVTAAAFALPAAADVQGTLKCYDFVNKGAATFPWDRYLFITDKHDKVHTVLVKANTPAFTLPGLMLGDIKSVGISDQKSGQSWATGAPQWDPGPPAAWHLKVTYYPPNGTGQTSTQNDIEVTAVKP